MANFYDIVYWTGLTIGAPFWLARAATRQKVFTALEQRNGKVQRRMDNNPAILIHAVSLGEVNATQSLIKMLRTARPDVQLILSTTTQTGHAQAMKLYPHGSGVTVVRYPLDFSANVAQLLNQLRPTVVVLMELELWPNFMQQCEERRIPVVLINGRLTKPSYRKYRLGGPIVKKMFSRLSATCVQDETYAYRFKKLSAPSVVVTGTMKFDTAQITDFVAGADELAREVGLNLRDERVWVCGSTGPGEEEIILKEYREMLRRGERGTSGLRLVIVPRAVDRFDEVAELITKHKFNVMRRSAPRGIGMDPAIPPVVLGDTLGELKKFYELADVIFVGRSLVDLGARQHGSDMIEAAALTKPIIVGHYTHNFSEAMKKFREANAIVEVKNGAALASNVLSLLNDPKSANEMATRARQVVEREQGATAKHARVILVHLPPIQPPPPDVEFHP